MIDRVLRQVAPQMALKRAVARRKLDVINSGYGNHGASRTKKSLIGWVSKGGSPNDDIEENHSTLRERSRDLWMGTSLASGAIKTIRTNVVGSGLRLNAQIDYEYLGLSQEEADQWETNVEREFSLWADSLQCDVQQMNNFYELQGLAFISFLLSGDSFGLLPYIQRPNMPYDLRVQIVESDRVSTPEKTQYSLDQKIVNGVEVGKYGEVVAYHFAQFHPSSFSLSLKKEWKRIEKFGKSTGRLNVIHLMESERPDQRRGVPVLAPVMESMKQLGRYTDAELMAALVSGLFTVFVKTDNSDERPIGESIPEDERVDDLDENTYELGNGTMIGLGENESIEVANPSRQNVAFDGFVTSICRQIGSALEIPYELLLKHFTSSYSASRGALLEAWKMFKMRRTFLANKFCQPVYEEWLSEAVAKGRIHAPGFFNDPMVRKAYCGSEWNGPSHGQLDPVKEAKAAKIRVEEGFSTRARETVELNGGDYWRNHRQRIVEEEHRREGNLVSSGELPEEPQQTTGD